MQFACANILKLARLTFKLTRIFFTDWSVEFGDNGGFNGVCMMILLWF